jgi:hypothetical protein
MQIKKFENSRELDVAEKLSEIFFEKCDNFGSEEEQIGSTSVMLIFYFPYIDDLEFEQIEKCKKFIEKYEKFNISHKFYDITLNFKLEKFDYYELNEKLDLYKNSKQYNL